MDPPVPGGQLRCRGDPDPTAASAAAFVVVAAGGCGCVAAGLIADRLGRTTVTMAAMAAS